MLNLDDAKLEKHSVTISGHRTSISLEKGFWRHLRQYAEQESISMNELVKQIDEARTGSLSGALRSFVLKQLEDHIAKLQD